MSEFLLYSDLHIRPERITDCETALSSILQIALKRREKTKKDLIIVNGGDTFHTRGIIKTRCLDVLYKHYSQWAAEGFKQFIVVGNHDQEDRAGQIHPLNVFSFKGWKVADRPMVDEETGLALLPYMPNDQIESSVKCITKEHGKKKLNAVVHWGFIGAKRNDFNTDTDGVPVEMVKDFIKVYSGHYHLKSSIGNVQYIGSPFQQDHGERNQDKGVTIFNDESGKELFVEIEGTSKHYEIEMKWEDGEEIISEHKKLAKNDFVLIRASGDVESCSSIDKNKLMKKLGCENIKLDKDVREKAFSRLNIDKAEILSPSSLAEKYVDFVETDLNKKKLLEIGLSIISGESNE